MVELWLLRHTVSIWNKEGIYQGQCFDEPGLAPEGIAQAREIGEFLRGVKICGIWTSPLPRAMQLAKIISDYQHRLPVIHPERDLMEWTNGEADGMSFEEIKKKFPAEWKLWEKRITHIPIFPGGESLENLAERGRNVIYKIMKTYSRSRLYPNFNGVCIGIGHGAINGFTLASLLRIPLKQGVELVPQENGCINKLRLNGNHIKVIQPINITSHLNNLRYSPDIAV